MAWRDGVWSIELAGTPRALRSAVIVKLDEVARMATVSIVLLGVTLGTVAVTAADLRRTLQVVLGWPLGST